MRIFDNDIERDATPEEEAYFQEQLEMIVALPKPIEDQISVIEQQTLDIAEAVVSLYETMTIGVDG